MWTIKSGNSLRINRENPPFGNRILFIFAYVELGRIILSMRRESGKETVRPRTRVRPRTERRPLSGRKEGCPRDCFFNRTKGD